MFQYTAGSSVL